MTDIKSADNQPKGKRKHRSPNYPAISLKRALELAAIQYREDMRHQIPVEVTFKRWGYKKDQGSLYLAAVKSFGFVEVEGIGKNRQVRVTDVARRIILDSSDSPDLLKQAALKPKIYSEVWKKYDGELPRDDVLSHYLKLDLNFNEKSVAGFISQFRETISFVKLEKSDILEPAKKDVINNGDNVGGSGSNILEKPKKTPDKVIMTKLADSAQFRELKFLLPSGEAVLFVPSRMKASDFTILTTYLEAFKSATEQAVEPGDADVENEGD